MQSNKISFKGQNIYVGIDVHLKTWHVTTLTESGYKYSFAQHADAKELFDRLNKKFPEAHFKSAYEAGFCGFSAHYALTEQGIENIVVNAADIPTTGKKNRPHDSLFTYLLTSFNLKTCHYDWIVKENESRNRPADS